MIIPSYSFYRVHREHEEVVDERVCVSRGTQNKGVYTQERKGELSVIKDGVFLRYNSLHVS